MMGGCWQNMVSAPASRLCVLGRYAWLAILNRPCVGYTNCLSLVVFSFFWEHRQSYVFLTRPVQGTYKISNHFMFCELLAAITNLLMFLEPSVAIYYGRP